ncbi:hypothetical protein C8R44DRAFT_750458 [Mycena epipterygia]|nr:hypothetical protein C8R44DRAFT_750458 [Mycena epipterygia]
MPEVKPKIKIQPKPRLYKPKIPALIIKSESSSGSFTPDSADIKGLPGFIGGTWSTLFLPACYQALYLSDDPMAIGAVGDDLLNPGKETVAILAGILKAVYSGNTWALAWGDPICTKAVSRIGERRSAFGRTALQAVDRVFTSSRYFHRLDSPTPGVAKKTLVASDARTHFSRTGRGPFYKQPSPEDKLKPKQADYVIYEDFSVVVTETPDGKEIIDFARSVLPTGALGLTALGIERGYRMHRSGVRVAKDKVSTFSSINFGPALAGFIKGIGEFKVSRWESIIKSCGALIVEVVDTPSFDPDFEMDSLDGVREHIKNISFFLRVSCEKCQLGLRPCELATLFDLVWSCTRPQDREFGLIRGVMVLTILKKISIRVKLPNEACCNPVNLPILLSVEPPISPASLCSLSATSIIHNPLVSLENLGGQHENANKHVQHHNQNVKRLMYNGKHTDGKQASGWASLNVKEKRK